MFCKNCGAVVDDDAEFCESCGTKITKVSPIQESVPTTDPTPIPSANTEQAEIPGSKKAINPLKFILPVAALLVVAVVVVVVFVKNSTGGKSANVDPRAQSNFNNGAIFAYDDTSLYFIAPYDDDDDENSLYSTSYSGTNKTKLSSNEEISQIRIANGKILYKATGEESYSIGFIDKDGKNETIIVELERNSDSSLWEFDASSNALYYLYGDELHSCTLEGENDTVLASDVEHFVLAGKMIYYSTVDSIYSYSIKKGEDTKLCGEEANSLVYDNGNIFYSNDNGIFYVSATGESSAQRVAKDSSVGYYVIDNDLIYYLQKYDTDDIIDIAKLVDSDNYQSYAIFLAGCGTIEQVSKQGGAIEDVDSDQALAYSIYAYPEGMYSQLSLFSNALFEVTFQ